MSHQTVILVWRKWVDQHWLHANEEKFQAIANNKLVVVAQPNKKRLQLEISCDNAKQAHRLVAAFDGKVEELPRDWLTRFTRQQKRRPLRIGARLIVAAVRDRGYSKQKQLIIPAGLAFGTGDHATTVMSLRLLEEISRKLKPGWSLVDLGTGSGILALAAKCFGARHVLGIDIDPQAIRTAKENARLNKIAKISFRIADARRLKLPRKIEILTANLFSELLIEVLPKLKIAHWLILSGVLRAQERDLRRALRSHKIDTVVVRRRGKWIALVAQKLIDAGKPRKHVP